MGASCARHDVLGPDDDDLKRVLAVTGLPCFVKPVSGGSSVGVTFVREKKTLASFHPHGIHGEHGMSIWTPAPPGVQEQLVEDEPDRFYRPPYVGHRGWIGVRLDRSPDWDEIAAIVEEAYRLVAPKTLVAQLGRRPEDG